MAGNIEVGDLVARISFDDTGLNKSMAAITRQMKLVESEFGKASAGIKNYGSTSAQLETKTTTLTQKMQLQQQRINQLNEAFQKSVQEKGEDDAATQRLAAQLNNAQAQYNRLEGELRETTEELERQRRAADIAASAWTKMGASLTAAGDKLKKVGDSMAKIGKNMSMYVTAPIAALGTLSAKAAIDFESAFAGVEKTVEGTEAELAVMRQGLRDMAKIGPSTAVELSKIAEAAGQLGIQNDAVLSFTNTMSDLGVTTNLTSEEAATALARLANITQMPQTEFDRLGSSIVALGNNMATTEREIVEMSLRLAAQGKQVGMSEAQITALSATMSSLGIEAEAGGTAMTTVLKKINKAVGLGGAGLEEFANASGTDSKTFAAAWSNDPIKALDMFLKGLNKSSKEGKNLSLILADMGVKGVRESDAILRMAGASDLLSKAVATSTSAWTENSALTDEAAKRYATTESKILTLKNQLTDLAITFGEILLPIITQIINAVTPWIEKFSNLSESSQKIILVLAGIAAAIGPVLVIVGSLISSVGTIISTFGALSTAIGAAGGASAVFGGALAAITGPIGIAVAAIVGIVAAIVMLYKKNEEFRNFVNKTWDDIKKKFMEVWQSILNFIKPLINNMVAFFKGQLTEIKAFWDENGAAIMKVVKTAFTILVGYIKIQMAAIETVIRVAWEIIKGVITIAWSSIKMVISNALDLIMGIIKVVMKVLQGDWKGAWEAVKQTVSNIWGNIETFLKNVNLIQIGKDIMGGLIKGISSMANAVKEQVKNITDSITNGIKSALKINSPSKVTTEIGVWTGEGLAIGLNKSTAGVTRQAAALAQAAIPNMSKIGAMETTSKQSSGSAGGVINFDGLFSGAIFQVRTDSDIKRIAQELFSMQRTAMRGAGMT